MLELKGVCKEVEGVAHLTDVSLRLEAGVLNVLLGPTLSGKTSLMRIMAGLDRPSGGAVLVDGQDVTGVAVQKRNVAMVYQQFINYPALSVYENIASPLRIARRPAGEIDAAVRRIADLLKLTALLDRLPLQLSGGQQQRIALARALAKNAQLVLLDEPLANLDYKLREELRTELPRLFEKAGAIVVYATAEPEEALLLGGNTATMEQGRVTQFGPTVEVYRRPNTLATARTFSDPPLNWARVRKEAEHLHPVHEEGAPHAEALPVPAAYAGLADGDYIVAVRPHHLSLHPRGGVEDVRLAAQVTATEITGSQSYVHMRCLGTWVMLTPGVHDLASGSFIVVHLDLARLLVFDAQGRAIAPCPVREAA